jgi:nucleoid-associated protein YgaU
MSDVEKYGLFAVVFVGGLLLLIAVQGGFGEDGEVGAIGPVVLDAAGALGVDEPALKPGTQPHRLSPADSQPPATGPRNYVVKPLVSDEPFGWEDRPGPYPGKRSVQAGSTKQAGFAQTPPTKAQPILPRIPKTYTVKSGDTLGEISLAVLGTSKRAKEIFDANRDQLKSMDDVRIGQVLVMPGAPKSIAVTTGTGKPSARDLRASRLAEVASTKPKTGARVASDDRTHTVVSGDTLGEISMTYLGTSRRATEIFEANKDVLKSPDALVVGQTLRIP